MLKIFFSKIKTNLYLIIPIICIVLWAIYTFIQFYFINHLSLHFDFSERVREAYVMVTDPENLYHSKATYHALPSQILLFLIFLLFPLVVANRIYFVINTFLGILTVYEFNKILKFMDIKEKLTKFIFLMIISNGFVIFHQFWLGNVKFIVESILFFIIRRELQCRKGIIEKNLKYYFINYGFFLLALGIYPPFIYLLFIYLFQNIRHPNLFKKKSIQQFTIIIFWFALQNFIIFIYPSLILDLFRCYFTFYSAFGSELPFFYLGSFGLSLEPANILFITNITNIIILLITLILIFNKKLTIEFKFAYFCLASIYVGSFAGRVLVVILPFTLLIFIQFLREEKKFLNFLKNNKILILGLIGIIGIYFIIENNNTYYKYIPILEFYPYRLFFDLRYIYFLVILGFSVIKLHLSKIKIKKL